MVNSTGSKSLIRFAMQCFLLREESLSQGETKHKIKQHNKHNDDAVSLSGNACT